jgi:hypothetical protein
LLGRNMIPLAPPPQSAPSPVRLQCPASTSGGRIRAPVIFYLPCLIINYSRF